MEDLFSPRFDFVEFKAGVFARPAAPKAFFCLLQKRG